MNNLLMRNLASASTILLITTGFAVSGNSVLAETPDQSDFAAARTAVVAKWSAEPYVIEPPDVLSVEVTWQDFDGSLTVSPTPTLQGRSPQTNLTMTGVEHLKSDQSDLRTKAAQLKIEGEYLVGPDGKVCIAGFAPVSVVGLNVEEAQQAIAAGLAQQERRPTVRVDVAHSNSKVLCLIERTEGVDKVLRIPHTWSLTVLDVLAYADTNKSDTKKLALAPSGDEASNRIEIYLGVFHSKENGKGNHRLLPGDRVFVEMVSIDNTAKVAQPPAVPPTEVVAPCE